MSSEIYQAIDRTKSGYWQTESEAILIDPFGGLHLYWLIPFSSSPRIQGNEFMVRRGCR